MKKNVLFISSLDISKDRIQSDGVTKKLLLQMLTFSQMDYNVDYIYRIDSKVYLRTLGKDVFLTTHNGIHYKTMRKVYRLLIKMSQSFRYDLIYIRYEGNSIPMWHFLQRIRHVNQNIKVVAELPTFMKKWEPGTKLKGKIAFVVHKLMDNLYRMPIDYMVTFDNHRKLFGYPTIQIENFANVEALPIKSNKEKENEFHILALAMMTPSHGYDRIIRGINRYYKTDGMLNVILHLVGNGYVLEKWKRLTSELGLDEHVIFHGPLHGDELDNIFNLCNVAAASLAIFRKGCKKASELKIREYTARGIPFFYSAYEPQIRESKFCLKVSHDEKPIDIQSIIDFYNSTDWEHEKYNMHRFAEDNFSCQAQLKRIIDEIHNNLN